MKNSTSFIVIVIVVGLVIGGILIGTPKKSNTDENGTQTALPKDALGEYETFTEYNGEICKENNKPVVYLFSTTTCPHCEWVKDTFDKWAKENDKIAAYHWQFDSKDNTLTEQKENAVPTEVEEVFTKFNPEGSVPTFVFGCKYARVGNAFENENDLNKEIEVYNKIVDKLTQ